MAVSQSSFDDVEDNVSGVDSEGAAPIYQTNVCAQLYGAPTGTQGGDKHYSVQFIKKYITYAKSRIEPKLTPEAANIIATEYTNMRVHVRC